MRVENTVLNSELKMVNRNCLFVISERWIHTGRVRLAVLVLMYLFTIVRASVRVWHTSVTEQCDTLLWDTSVRAWHTSAVWQSSVTECKSSWKIAKSSDKLMTQLGTGLAPPNTAAPPSWLISWYPTSPPPPPPPPPPSSSPSPPPS